jgi:hypothetical protein
MMRTQKNRFKVAIMTLAAVGLTTGAFISSAQAEAAKEDPKFDLDHLACYKVEEKADEMDYGTYGDTIEDREKVVLYNQFEWGTKVYVGKLELLCVPTHKVHDQDDGHQDDGHQDDGHQDDGPQGPRY